MNLTTLFVLLIILFFVIFLGCGFLSRQKSPSEAILARYFAIGPGFLTTLGVFGTFLGILVGLLEFDVERVDESVPLLLEGLKVAFVSSVAGLITALILRLVQPALFGGSQGASDDPIEILGEILKENQLQAKALSGGEDSSLLTQLQKIRTTLSDNNEASTNAIERGFENQIGAFNAFAEKMAENNSKALIEALEEVIRDFNTKISEQFGENFKQLNDAVGKLLQWQEQYRLHIEQTERTLQSVSKELEKSSEALISVQNSFDKAPETAKSVERLIAEINDHLRITGDVSNGVADLRRELSGALPEIKKNVSDLTTGFTDEVKQASSALAKSAEEASSHYEAVSKQFADGLASLQSAMNSNFESFDEAMQQELTRALQLMGTQLASISNKIAEDYKSLADSLSPSSR